MWIVESYDPNACNISGMNNGMESWSWEQYRTQKEKFGDQIVLVDMINHPVEDSVTITNELFDPSNKPAGTVFCLYCHSGGSSWYVQMQLTPQLPMYKFVNISGWILAYN